MTSAVLEVFDTSLQKTQVWLNDLMRARLGRKASESMPGSTHGTSCPARPADCGGSRSSRSTAADPDPWSVLRRLENSRESR